MNRYIPELGVAGSAQRSTLRFEAPRRNTDLRPVAPISVGGSATPGQSDAREEKQALRFSVASGVAALVMWGVLLYALANGLQPPSLL